MWRNVHRQGMRVLLSLSQVVRRVAGRLPPYGVLKITLAGELPEHQGVPHVFSFRRSSADDYPSVLALLRWARDDSRLRGVLIRCEDLRIGWARIQGLRRALMALRQAGKLVWVHLIDAGVPEYYLASAAQRIVLAPSASLNISGLSSEVTFLFGSLEKLGVEAEIIQVGRYKSVGETFTRREMSGPHREMVEALVDDLYGQLVEAVAEGRGLTPETARTLLDRGPLLGHEALAERLVDAIAYEDQAEAEIRSSAGDVSVIEFHDYLTRRGREIRADALRQADGTIGLVHLNGTVKTGDSLAGPDGASSIGAASVARDLKELRERKDIRAVVLRVASPGGSGMASDLIWREVVRTREEKPVVVSFGDVAASGGYYIGVAGKPVLAEAGTLTGSIGVLAGKANLRGLYDRLGVTKEIVSRGRHPALASAYLSLTDEDRELLRCQAESFYHDFVSKVARSRKLSEEAVHSAGEGRVWTGRQAWTRGLVDQLGGLEEALVEAKRLVGIPDSRMVPVERFPKPRRLWKLPFQLGRPHANLSDLMALVSPLQLIARERLWAILPLHFRFF